MTAFAAAEITKERLKTWQRRNERERLACTPAILISVNHDPAALGQIVLNTTHDLPDDKLRALLVTAIASLDNIKKGN